MPVAAMAEQMAYLFWLTFILLCHLLHVFVGANIRPPRHMLPKAPWPDLWVPPPLTLGIRATALPVPHDSAEVWWPVIKWLLLNYQKIYLYVVFWQWSRQFKSKKIITHGQYFYFTLSKEIAHPICKHVNIYYNDSLCQIFMLFLCWL